MQIAKRLEHLIKFNYLNLEKPSLPADISADSSNSFRNTEILETDKREAKPAKCANFYLVFRSRCASQPPD